MKDHAASILRGVRGRALAAAAAGAMAAAAAMLRPWPPSRLWIQMVRYAVKTMQQIHGASKYNVAMGFNFALVLSVARKNEKIKIKMKKENEK